MTVREAIAKANDLRLNTLDDEQKAKWIYEVDCTIAEMKDVDQPEFTWPDDSELLMEAPFDNIYTLYLVSMFDYYNEEIQMYQNDMQLFNQAMADCKAYYIRHNRKMDKGNWRTLR